MVIADALIAVAYFSIPIALIYFARKRSDFPHVGILYLFGAFIIWCGVTHAVSIWTLWVPVYGIEVLSKVVTAVVSVVTAVTLWPLMPRVLAIPGPGLLQQKNDQLRREVSDRIIAEARLQDLTASLERRVHERTQELLQINERLERENERRMRVEEQLLAAKLEAEDANRAKTIFLAGMSHELRSPLNSIIGFAQMLNQNYAGVLDSRQQDYARNIETSGNVLLALIERLLDLSKIEAGRTEIKLESTDIVECLRKAEAILQPVASEANVDFTMTVPDGGPVVVTADPIRLTQIFINLGTNAVKYNHPGGRTDISVIKGGDGKVTVRFTDTGLGIPADLHDQVFQTFNRLSRERSKVDGAGIGLALSKRLADAMGASLTFISVEGQGSIFSLTLAAG